MCLGGRSSRLICRAAEWSDPDFAADVLRRFPEDGVANTEEAMVLLRNGYEWLDIRTKVQAHTFLATSTLRAKAE